MRFVRAFDGTRVKLWWSNRALWGLCQESHTTANDLPDQVDAFPREGATNVASDPFAFQPADLAKRQMGRVNKG